MSLVNGGTYYGFTAGELAILERDGDYTDIVGLFTIQATIGGVDYYFAPSSAITNAMEINGRLEEDNTDPTGQINSVTLDSAVYYSAFGFKLIP